MANFKEPRRFWDKVDVREVNECWEWLAYKDGYSGYGQFGIHGRKWQAHRVAWILTYGPIPEGLHCCHHCDNPGCVNPYHLFLGTNRDNHLDAVRKGRLATKLTEEDVHEIRKLYAEGERTQQEIADGFDISNVTVSDITRGKTWSWVDKEDRNG